MTALDRQRLARVLGLLGSEHDGEIAAAGRQAERIRRAAGLTWPEILDNDKPAERIAPPTSPAEAIGFCLDYFHLLTDWEQGFIASISRRGQLTAKQLDVLRRITRGVFAQAGGRRA